MALAEYTDDESLSPYKKRILVAVGEGKINTFNLCLRLIKDNIALEEDPLRKSTPINKELEHFSKVFLDGKATLKVNELPVKGNNLTEKKDFLESLKREIEKERLNIKSLDIKRPNACAYREGLLDTLIWLENTCLCNSQEQKNK